MIDADRLRATLAAAPASRVVEALAAELAAEAGLSRTELLLVDYRLTTLLPLSGLDAAPPGAEPQNGAPRAPGSAAWRCFDHQELVGEGDAAWVPVTVRGERLGVLLLGPATGSGADLLEVGRVLAHELAAARPTTDRYLASARARRLTLAAEMQWETLPGRSCIGPQFTLAGQLEPAYSIKGDTFDWAIAPDRLTVSVLDGMGEGVAAASLSLLATSAIRNARRAGLGIEDQAMLADSAVYAQHGGACYVSALLLEIELSTGLMSVVDTGSPMVILMRGDDLTTLEPDRLDPVGMFDSSRYTAQQYRLEPGDRLVIVSDGIHVAESAGRRYGESDLQRLVRRCRVMQPLDVVRTLIGDLRAFVSGELDDDAATVCLDWFGNS